MKRKRIKQVVAILLAVTMITFATAKPYQEAKATGLGGAAGAAAGAAMGVTFAEGVLIGTAVVGGLIVVSGVTMDDVKDLYEAGKKGEIEKIAEKSAAQLKEDFYNHTVQALNNNVSAAEQQRDNAAHARSVIDDFLESASAGVIDTTSEAWRWFQDFISDIRNALAGSDDNVMNGVAGSVLDGTYNIAEWKKIQDGYPMETLYHTIQIRGLDMSKLTAASCVLACEVNESAVNVTVARIAGDGKLAPYGWREVKRLGAEFSLDGGKWGTWDGLTSCIYNSDYVKAIPLLPVLGSVFSPSTPAGTTDVPGVANPSDYVAVGSDLPYNRPEGAWDICDPNGKQGQVSIGADIPGKLGYDDWYDLLGGVATGDTTWEEVANASDVITIGSDLANDYSPSNAKDWSAYHDGTIVGYDVDAAGNVTITFEDGAVISIPQEYVSGMEWVNEQDKAQELDKDTALPVSGSLAYPLPAIQDPAVPADPQDPGGGSGDMKIDDDVKDYTLDFRKLFPFCIPFDIYKAVKLLDATPTAPVVHYKFYYKKSKSYTIDINLNKFNSVAAILRRMECLLFIIGLATATRRIYLRG